MADQNNMGGVPPENGEELYRRIASDYAERYGAELRRELAELDESAASQITPGLDRRVRGEVARLKRGRYIRIAALVAACLLLVLAVPYMGVLIDPGSGTSSGPTSSAGAASSAPAASTAEPAPGDGGDMPALIPLSFTLPANLSVADAKLDNGKSVYYLQNTQLDDIVMTMEKRVELETEGLAEIEIDGAVTYGMSWPDYSLLTFRQDEIVYVLTCKHDINTLVSLGENILV